MATKDINRSALEGGRPGRDKEERRVYQRRERHATKLHLKKVALDAEEYYKTFEPVRGKIWRSFTDNLGPAYRWIDSNVGKSWSDVYSALREKFDPRTLAGHHLVNQHIIPSIDGAGGEEFLISGRTYGSYYVDEEGVLRKKVNEKYKRITDFSEIKNWAKGRRIDQVLWSKAYGKNQYKYFWKVPSEPTYYRCSNKTAHKRPCKKFDRSKHVFLETTPEENWKRFAPETKKEDVPLDAWWRTFFWHHEITASYKRTRELTQEEEAYLKSFGPYTQRYIMDRLVWW